MQKFKRHLALGTRSKSINMELIVSSSGVRASGLRCWKKTNADTKCLNRCLPRRTSNLSRKSSTWKTKSAGFRRKEINRLCTTRLTFRRKTPA